MLSSTAVGKRTAIRTTQVIAALLLASAPLVSQEFHDPWRWTTFEIGDALTPNRVIDIVETSDGTAWATMPSGIRWSEGYEWNVVNHPSPQLPRQPIVVTPLSDSTILAVFGWELFAVGKNGIRSIPVADGSRSFGILSGAVTSSGSILALDSSGTLWESLPQRRSFERSRIDDLPTGAYWIHNSRPGSVWVYAEEGLFHLRNRRFELRLRTARRITPETVIRENERGEGIARVVFRPPSKSLFAFDREGLFKPIVMQNDQMSETVDIRPDGTRIVTFMFGVMRLVANGKLTDLQQVPVQMHNLLFLRSRANGDLWAGSEIGLSLHRTLSLWMSWKHPTPGLGNQIAEIIRTRDGSVWAAHGLGIDVHHPDGRVQELTSALGTSLSFVTAMAEDQEGNIWVGSGSTFSGALRWDGKAWKRFGPAEGLGVRNVHKIRLDKQGRVWFLGIAPFLRAQAQFDTEIGAFVLDHGRFVRWGVEEGLVNGRVYAMGEGPDETLWFGTAGGISRWKDGIWRHWKNEQGLISRRVFSLAVDTGGVCWFADQNNGIGYIDSTDQVRYLTTAHGLISNSVWEVKFDNEGTLWCATNGGLAGYRNGIWFRFGVESGLPGLHLWPIMFDRNFLYVGTLDGGVAILDRSAAQGPAPKIVPARPIVEGNTALLRWKVFPYWGESPIQSIEVRSRLNGGAWSSWQASKERVLIDLASGSHTVVLQAKNRLGEPGPETPIAIEIPRPWYRSTAFLILAALVGGALIVQRSFYINRRRDQQQQLEASERRYRSLFEDSSLSIWEEDVTDVYRAFEGLRARGNTDLVAYLDTHPEEVARIARSIRIIDVNRATVDLYKAESKEELIRRFEDLKSKPPGPYMRRLVMRLAEGGVHHEAEVAETVFSGEPMYTFVRASVVPGTLEGRRRMIVIVMDISERRKNQRERENLIANLEEALANVKTLRGLIPICSSCKKIRDDRGYWNFLEQYITQHSEAVISHGLCPECAKRLYPGVFDKDVGQA